jgi:hypothetical protein
MSALGQPALPVREGWMGTVLRTSYRYGLSSLGPVAVSAAHFIASLLFLRLLPPAEFGRFSFLLIVVPFCLGASGSLLGAPASLTRGKPEAVAYAEIATLHKASLFVSLLAGIVVTALMFSTNAGTNTTLLFGLYGAASVLRGFARSLSNVHGRIEQVAASDILYSLLLVTGLAALAMSGGLTMHNAAIVLVFAIVSSFLPFGADYVFELIGAATSPVLRSYRTMWREVTRWSLLGVVLTELTVNAHAYLVTFISGPGAFGLLALGALFMRPASLVLSALPDIDMPVMARRIAQGDIKGAFRVVREFRTAAMAVLTATVILAFALVIWFPHLLLKNFAVPEVLWVLGFWITITMLRAVRTPEAVFVQATADYPALARIAAFSCVAALALTLVLLVAFGPIASLGGVLAGEVVITLMLFPLTRVWRKRA